eukprot:364998-Chlamydomonas_euryale.AAC.9
MGSRHLATSVHAINSGGTPSQMILAKRCQAGLPKPKTQEKVAGSPAQSCCCAAAAPTRRGDP